MLVHHYKLPTILLLEMRTQRYALGSHSAAILVDMHRMAAAAFAYRDKIAASFTVARISIKNKESGPVLASFKHFICLKWAKTGPRGRAFGSHPRGREFESLQVHQTGIGRTHISSAAASPWSVRSDPQQESAVLEVIPRRRFLWCEGSNGVTIPFLE